MEKVVNIVNKVLDGGSGGHSPPEAEAFLVFECENMASPESSSALKKTRYCPPRSGGKKQTINYTKKKKMISGNVG